MKKRPGFRVFRPAIQTLETRRLLSLVTVTSGGQDGTNLVGIDASPGPGAFVNLHLALSGLQSANVSAIHVHKDGGFDWQFGRNPNAFANAEFFQSGTTGDLYISPQVDSDAGLSSSTGAPIALKTGDTLDLSVYYNGSQIPQDSGSVKIPYLSSPLQAAPSTPTPTSVIADSAITANWSEFPNNGQDDTGHRGTDLLTGFVHLKVTGLPGTAIQYPIQTAQLSDSVGGGGNSYWQWPGPSTHWFMTVSQSSDDTSADIYFPPKRDETANVSGLLPSADQMTLRLTFANDANQYVVEFPGGPWDPALLATPVPQAAQTVSDAQTLESLLSTPPQGQQGPAQSISLQAGLSFTLDQPLVISNSIKIDGNGDTLVFNATNWALNTPGAIYSTGNYAHDYTVDLENVTIKFDETTPVPWFDPANFSDPGGSSDSKNSAVINLDNTGQTHYAVTLSHVTVLGPRPYFPAGYDPSANPTHPEAAMNLFDSGGASGFITGCTFQGGSIALNGGPWTVTGNTDNGAYNYTFSTAVVSVSSAHDVDFEGNTACQAEPNGHLFRLINFADNSSYDDYVYNNTFTGGYDGLFQEYVSGDGRDVAPYVSSKGLNDPETILAEGQTIFYEGPTGAVSPDGRILVLPEPSSTVRYRTTGADTGWVVSVVNTENSDGSPDAVAGKWYRIAQVISLSPPTFLMEEPFPSGDHIVSITSGFVDDAYRWNTLNIQQAIAGGISLMQNFGTDLEYNTINGSAEYGYDYTPATVMVNAIITNPQAGAPFPIPAEWTDDPSLGVTISNNTLVDCAGGIVLKVDHGFSSHVGRRYIDATIEGNNFRYNRIFLDAWKETFYSSITVDGNPANDTWQEQRPNDQSYYPPTVTIGDGFRAGLRKPWTIGGPYGFVDPYEVNVEVDRNQAVIVNADSTTTARPEPSGQVYAGIVNNAVAPVAAYPYNQPDGYWVTGLPGTRDNPQYAPYDANNLDVNGALVPTAPQGLAAAPESDGSIALQWNASEGAAEYLIERSSGGQSWSQIDSTSLTFYYDTGSLLPSTLYSYRIRAQNAAGPSDYSYTVSATTVASSSPPSPYMFDFGPTGSPVAAGFTAVDANTVYNGSGSPTYGWSSAVSASNFFNYTTVANATAVTEDGYFGADFAFQVDLPDGVYNVTPTLGDLNGAVHTTNVVLQGSSVGVVTTAADTVSSPTYQAVVADGRLVIELQGVTAGGGDGNAYIEGLVITAQPLKFAFAGTSSSVPSGYTAVNSDNAWYTSNGLPNYGFEWPTEQANFTSDAIYAVVATFQVDLPNGVYNITPTLGGATSGSQTENVYLQGTEVATVTTAANESTSPTYQAVVSDGRLQLRLQGVGGSAYIEELVIAAQPLKYSFGWAGTPVPIGYTQINNGGDALYDSSKTPTFGLVAYTSPSYTNNAFLDTDATLQVDLPNGVYNVVPTLGGVTSGSQTENVYLQGTEVATVTTTANETTSPTYQAVVTDGRLQLRLQGVGGSAYIEGLVIAPQLQGTIIDPVSAWASSTYNGNVATFTIDGSGLSSPLATGAATPATYPTVDNTFNNNWVSANGDGQSGAEVLKFQLVNATDAPVDLAGFHLWAYSADEPERSIATADVWTSPDDGKYTFQGTYTFYEGNNAADEGQDYALAATSVRFVKFTNLKNYDPTQTLDPYGSYVGLSEIRFMQPSQAALVDRSTNAGGTATARGENSPNQVAANLFDGDLTTTWLDFSSTSWVQYEFPDSAAYVITQYAITSGGDTATYPGRAPKSWVLKGSNDGGNTWVPLDTETNQADTLNVDTRSYTFLNTTAYQCYRLDDIQSNGDSIVQLTEIKLLGPGSAVTELAQGKTSVASSTESSSYTADEAVDGDSTTRWSSGQWTQPNSIGWIYVDLGAVYSITDVTLNWETAYAVNYLIQVSIDGNTWTTIDTITGNASSGVHDYAGLSGSGRYVRIYCTATSTANDNYSLYDFKVYGSS